VRGSNPLGSTSKNTPLLIKKRGHRAINVPLALSGIALRLNSHAESIGDLPVGIAGRALVKRRRGARSGPSEGPRELGEIPDLPEINSGAVRRES
ncbi:hypothetical protein, partial [Microbispora corallina]